MSCAPLIAGSLYLASSGEILDWVLIAIFALPLGPHIIVPGLASVLIIHFQIPQKLSSLFDNSEAVRGETGRPVLFKCKTIHGQISTEKHAFDYSCLLVGVLVGKKGRNGGILEAEKFTVRERAWFEVRAEDHLHRGGGDLGLLGKLEAYLNSQVSNKDSK